MSKIVTVGVLVLGLLLAGAAYAWGHHRAAAALSEELAEKISENARLLTLQQETEARAEESEARFDSLNEIHQISAQEAADAIQHWRERYRGATESAAGAPGESPQESPGRPNVERLLGLLSVADSTITICEDALGNCEEAVAEAEAMQVAERRARFAAAERAAVMEGNWNDAEATIASMRRWRPYREAAIGVGGLLVGLGACFVAR